MAGLQLKKDKLQTARDYFNPSTYMVVDRVTGEEIDVSIFIEKAKSGQWQKAYAKTLAEFIRCGDGKAVDVLAYILEKKDNNNFLHGTQREISAKTNVSLAIVSRTFKALESKSMLKKVRSGCYMVDPSVMRNGDNKVGAIMFRLWGDLKK